MNSGADILHEILGSRRLLAEHVECLQLVADEADVSAKLCGNRGGTPQFRHLVKSALVSGASVLAAAGCVHKCINLKLPATPTITISLASTVCAIYSIRHFRRQLHHRHQLRHIRRLLATLEAFDVALRQRLKYLREAQLLASPIVDNSLHELQRSAKLRSYTANTISSAMPAIWATYAAIQRLEALPLASDYADIYQPTESLDNCELLQLEPTVNCTAQHVRDAHEIFQFLQSQLLVRLGLAVRCNAAEATAFLAGDVGRLVAMLEAQRQCLAGPERDWQQRHQLERRLEAMRAARLATEAASQAAALCGLRYACGDVLARMLALAEQLGAIEAEMQSAQQADAEEGRGWAERLQPLEAPLKRFAERLDACRDEGQRMLCQYHRLVHGDRRQQIGGVPQLPVSPEQSAADVRRFEECAPEETTPEAEFYALAEGGEGGDVEAAAGRDGAEDEQLDERLAALSTGIVKREFRPVLRQLRDRLEPINEAMRQRERSFLVAKGIAVEVEEVNSGSDEDEDALESRPARKDLYADSRQFLQDKQPMRLGVLQGFPVPAHRAMEEEILE